MRILAGCLALVVALACGQNRAPAGKPEDGTAERLVRQLGSRKYADREAATRQLEALGEPALPALRRAVGTADLEIRRRAEALVMRIEQRAEAARLLAGKRVRLVYRATPLADAVADLAARTGFDLRADDNAAGLRGRRVTLDTGATTAWDALSQFCRSAGLSEVATPPGEGLPDDNLILADGQATSLPTCLAGAVRMRALPLGNVKGGPRGAKGFRLEASPEPGMPWQGVVGVRLTRAVDERGQELRQPTLTLGGMPLPPLPADSPVAWDALSGQPVTAPADRRALPVWLAAGKQPAARLREVTGRLVVQVPVPRQLLALDRVLHSEGKTFDGTRGQSLQVLRVRRTDDTLRLHVRLRAHGSGGLTFQVARTPKGSLVMRGGQSGPPIHFVLQGADGSALRPQTREQAYFPNRGAGGLRMEFHLTFALKAGQADPGRLVCSGPVTTLLEVPFTLRDVPLAAVPPDGQVPVSNSSSPR